MGSDDPALVVLRTSGGDVAGVTLHGGQLLSWQPAGAGEQIYCSPLAQPAPGRALRGGAPICFPQFAERGPLPKHGFARNSRWELVGQPATGSAVAEARLRLDSAAAALQWEHAFRLELLVRLGPAWLELQMEAVNTGPTLFAFTAAIHTYFAVQDVRTATVRGLQGLTYEDSLRAGALGREAAAELRFPDEVDRVYRGVPEALELAGGGMPRRRVLQQGFADAVVWSPGPAKAARLGDMPGEDWVRMLCIEAAAVAQPVRIAPGDAWRGTQRLELLSP